MPADPNRVQAVFLAAVELPDPAARAALLDRECGSDAALRERVERLLAAHREDSFLRTRVGAHVPPVADSAGTRSLPGGATGTFPPDADPATRDHPSRSEHAGAVVAGKYTLVDTIGEGGMGSVWRAKQTEPVKRFVAVKLIKAGMDSKQVLARFEAERQALALMDHPNIAKVLDGGIYDGRPFFVMELVKGVPITEYCDAQRLTPQQRLELFVQVCQAIQHAHQKGVIHRDIKPSNVLVALYDDRPVVKVIDFGVAKAAGTALTERTLDTGFGAVVGTPQYMSPEQATFNNLDIDTRSDVYALGVLLYELLTGSPPFSKKELEQKGLMEILRVVREEEPPRPSTKLSTSDALPSLSANRGTEPKALTGLLRNDLDWIVMKALEKDRARRYETANGFAADVQRYLSGEPVLAHPPSWRYRFRKFLRKHRGGVTAAAVVAAALLVGLVGTGWGLVEARNQRDAADAARTVAEEASEREAAERKKAEERGQLLADKTRLLQERTTEAEAARSELDLELHDNQRKRLEEAWRSNEPGRMRAILDEMRPRPGRADHRKFEAHYLDRLLHPEVGLMTFKVRESATARELSGPNYNPGRLRVTFSIAPNHHYFAIDALDLATGKPPVGFAPIRGRFGANQVINPFAYIVPGSRARVFASAHLVPDFSRLGDVGHPEGELTAWDLQTGRQIARCERFYPEGRLTSEGWRQQFVWGWELGYTCDSQTTRAITEMVRAVPGARTAPVPHESRALIHDMKTGRTVLCLGVKPGVLERAGYSFDDRFVYTAHKPKALGQTNTFTIWDAATGREVWSRPEKFRGFTLDGRYAAFEEPPLPPGTAIPQPNPMPVVEVETGTTVKLPRLELTAFHPLMPDDVQGMWHPRLAGKPSERFGRLFETLGAVGVPTFPNAWLNDKGEAVAVRQQSTTFGPQNAQARETTYFALAHRPEHFEFVPFPGPGVVSGQLNFEGNGSSLRLVASTSVPVLSLPRVSLSRVMVFDPNTRSGSTTLLPPEPDFIRGDRDLEARVDWYAAPIVRGNSVISMASPSVRKARELKDVIQLPVWAVYDFATGRRRFVRTVEAALGKNYGQVHSGPIQLSPDGRWIAEIDRARKELQLLDAESGRLRWHLADDSESWQQSCNLTFLPDGSRLVANDRLTGKLRIIDMRTGEIVARVENVYGTNFRSPSAPGQTRRLPDGTVALSKDGRSLLITDEHYRLVVIDTETWTVRHRLGETHPDKVEYRRWSLGKTALSNRYVLQPNSTLGSPDTYEVWDLHTGRRHGRFEVKLHTNLTEYTVSEDGSRVFLLSNDVVHVVDLARGREVLRLPKWSNQTTQQTTPPEPVPAHMELSADGMELTVYSCWTKENTLVKRVYDARPLSSVELARSREIAAAGLRVQPPAPEPPGPPKKPETASDYFDLAKALNLGDPSKGQKADYNAAAAALREAISRDPDFFVLYDCLAAQLRMVGDEEGALTAFRESVKRYPAQVDSWYQIGQILARRRDFHGAAAAYREAFRNDDRTGRADAWSGMVMWGGAQTVSRAELHNALGTALLETGDAVGAERECREAVRLQPTLTLFTQQLLHTLIRQGKMAEAEAEAKALVTRTEEAARKEPNLQRNNTGEMDRVVASALAGVGAAYLWNTPARAAEAADWFDRAARRYAAFDKVKPGDQFVQIELRTMHWNRAIALNWADRGAEAVAEMDLALKTAEAKDKPYWQMMRARYQAKTKDWLAASRSADELLKTPPEPKPTWFLWDAALVHAQCARNAKDEKERERYSATAVQLLKRAVANGWDDLPLLAWDPDVEPLRGNAEFKALVEELKRKRPPEQAPPPREKK